MTWEVLPLLFASACVIVYVNFKPQLQNLLFGKGRFGFEALSLRDERFVAKKLASLLKYTYTVGK